MTWPTQPSGTIVPSDFGLNPSESSFTRGRPSPLYLYAVVPAHKAPAEWDNDKKRNVRRITDRYTYIITDSDTELNDQFSSTFPSNPSFSEMGIVSTEYTTSYHGWKQGDEQGENQKQYSTLSDNWDVLKIKLWNNHENVDTTSVHGFFVEYGSDLDYDDPGASDNRQCIEPLQTTDPEYAPGFYASSYHVQWCMAESINRSMYELRYSCTWPVWGDFNG